MSEIRRRGKTPEGKIKDRVEFSAFAEDFPVFCFANLQRGYDFRQCTKEEKIGVFNFIAGIAQSRWKDIMSMPRTGAGYERIYDSAFNVSIPVPLKGKKFIAFRGSGIMRIIGFRDGNVLHIIWLDIRGQVYDHG